MREKRFIQEAQNYREMKESVSRSILENVKFVKGQLADWYVAIAAVCFAAGGIALSNGRGQVTHPLLFWWGSLLLIANGVLIFFLRKIDLEEEDEGLVGLRAKEADLWTMEKVALEHAEGNHSRKDDYAAAAARFTKDYDEQARVRRWWRWFKFVLLGCMIDIVFGLLIFPLLMLASQLPNPLHITFRQYSSGLWALLVVYVAYTVAQARRFVLNKKKSDAAASQIRSEVYRKRQ